ncbi:MAG: alpha-E domain-containing protein [Chthonomonadales bacterium]
MLCRDADSCYWIGRYIERAEATARMIDVHYHFGLESPLIDKSTQWNSLLAISGSEEAYKDRYGAEEERNIIQFFVFDEKNPDSIRGCLKSTRENARTIREIISSEMWETLNRTWIDFQHWNMDQVMEVSPHEFFQWVKNASHLFQGITNRTLMMGESRDFLDSGRFLERADQSARLLDVKYHDILPRFTHVGETLGREETASSDPLGVGGPVDVHGWIAVLKSVGAYEGFRKTYHEVTPANVSDFLILSGQFPASVRHSVGRVDGCLRRVSGNSTTTPANDAERESGKLYNHLNFLTAREIIHSGLHEFLEDVQERCADVGNAIRRVYLKY